MAPLRGLPLLLTEGMSVHLTPPALKRERTSQVLTVSPCADGARVAFSCSRNLDDAETLAGCYVLARTCDFELGPLDSAYDDLLDREVVDDRHGSLGRIVEVMETPAHDVWVVEGPSYGEVLIPVVPEVVGSIATCGPLTVHVMDGLLDL